MEPVQPNAPEGPRPIYETRGPVRWVLALAASLALLTFVWFVFTAQGSGTGSPPPPKSSSSPTQGGGGKQEPPTQQPQSTASATASSAPPASVSPSSGTSTLASTELCRAGNGKATPGGRQDLLVHTGVKVPYPTDWSFRMDADQFGWLDDIHSFGKTSQGEMASVSVGVQPQGLPTAGDESVELAWTCLRTVGFLADATVPEDPGAKPTQINSKGLNGHELRVDTESGEGVRVHVVIRSYPSQGKRVVVIGYTNHPPLSAGEQEMQKVLDGIGPS